MNADTTKGLAWSLASAFLWSTTFVCARHLLGHGKIDPLTLSLARFLLGGMVLMGWGLAKRPAPPWRIGIHDMARLAGLALFGLTGMSVLLFYGQKTTTAINSSMLMQLSPVFILLLGVFIGERITMRNVMAIAVSLAGVMLVTGIITPDGVNDNLTVARGGDLLVLGGALCWALYSVFSKSIVQRLGGLTATIWVMLFGALEVLALRLWIPAEFIAPVGLKTWGMIVYLAVFPTALAFLAWYEAMRLINLAILNVMQYLTPVFTIILAVLILGERFDWMQGVGIGMVLAGVALLKSVGRRLATKAGKCI